MEPPSASATNALQTYCNALKFPPDLEREFVLDYAERTPPVLRRFFAFGLGLYMAFGILDYWALPVYYPTAWALRLVFGLLMFRLLFHTESDFFKRNILWMPAVWSFLASGSVLIMIYLAQPGEAGFVFYAVGLLLGLVATYISSGGDLLYPSLVGWLTVVAYMLIEIFRQHMFLTPSLALIFLVTSAFLVGMNLLCMFGGNMLVVSQRRDFLQRRVIEEQRATEEYLRSQADQLLLNILPPTVAERLKRGELVADLYEEASVLFADIVNFTPFSGGLQLYKLVEVLNEVFSNFDRLAESYDLVRIKTTGDGYLIAAGVPVRRLDHATVLTHLGLDMCEYFEGQTFAGQRLDLRVGVNSGPVVAAVIGLQRFSYDVWGDTVNTASRMESHGRSGMVQITASTHALIKDSFGCAPGGRIEVKGKGQMEVWHVLGAKTSLRRVAAA